MRFDTNASVKIRDAFAARHEPEAERLLGRVYWACLVTLFAAIALISIGYGMWEFIAPPKSDPEASVSVGAKKSITRTDIIKVLEGFDERAKNYETRRTAPAAAKDPS